MDEIHITRFWSRVDVRGPDECWPWTGSRKAFGYGQMWDGEKMERAHRIAFLITTGALAHGAPVRHSCDNPPCCNPSHLLGGTHLDNMRDRAERGRTARIFGESNAQAKLTDDAIRFIREHRGKLLQRELGDMFGVTQNMVSKIQLGQAWPHLP